MKGNRRSFLGKASVILGLGFIGGRANSKPLKTEDIIRAWEDPKFRGSLTESQWEALPENPAGSVAKAEFSGDLAQSSNDDCSGNNCSGNNCSGNNCSGDNCSGNNCSGNNCSGDNCSGNNCSGNNCGG